MPDHLTGRPDDFGPHRRQALDDLLGDAEYLAWPDCRAAHIWRRVAAGLSQPVPGPEAGERAWRTWGIHAIYRHVQAVHTYLRRHFAPQLAERAATVPEKHETPADKPRTKDQAPAVSADSRHPGGADRLVNDPVWQGVMEELLTFHSGDSAGGQRRDYVQALQDVLQQHTNDKRELPGRIVERLRTAIGRADTDRAAANRLIGDWVRNYRRRKR